MAENYLITGYWGEPHVTTENDRGINAAIFGTGRFVLPVGEMFRAEYIGNNKIRMYDGKLLDNGAAAGIPAGRYIDFTIPEAGQGMKRNDLICFQYNKDLLSQVETGSFIIKRGTETSGTPSDPEIQQYDGILSDSTDYDIMPLWRIPVSGATIGTPEQVFNTRFAGERITTAHSSDGENYTATLPGICHLYNGLEITVIFDIANTSNTVNLDLNGLGAKNVRVPLSFNTAALNAPDVGYFGAGRAVKLMFDGAYLAGKGAWKVVDRQKTSAQDLYGDVPVQNGGIAINTTSTDEDVAEACNNLLSILSHGVEVVTEDNIKVVFCGIDLYVRSLRMGRVVFASFSLTGGTSDGGGTMSNITATFGLPASYDRTSFTGVLSAGGAIRGDIRIRGASMYLKTNTDYDPAITSYASIVYIAAE